MAWKNHAYLVMWEELAPGTNCSQGPLKSDRETRLRMLDIVLEAIQSCAGDVFEFGVSSGESFLQFLDRCPDRQIYGFDSFEGIPEDWWTRPKGTFAAPPPQFTNPNGHLVKGWYDESLPRFLAIGMAPLPCYTSTATFIHRRRSLSPMPSITADRIRSCCSTNTTTIPDLPSTNGGRGVKPGRSAGSRLNA
jgi:hypothetical protein